MIIRYIRWPPELGIAPTTRLPTGAPARAQEKNNNIFSEGRGYQSLPIDRYRCIRYIYGDFEVVFLSVVTTSVPYRDIWYISEVVAGNVSCARMIYCISSRTSKCVWCVCWALSWSRKYTVYLFRLRDLCRGTVSIRYMFRGIEADLTVRRSLPSYTIYLRRRCHWGEHR